MSKMYTARDFQNYNYNKTLLAKWRDLKEEVRYYCWYLRLFNLCSEKIKREIKNHGNVHPSQGYFCLDDPFLSYWDKKLNSHNQKTTPLHRDQIEFLARILCYYGFSTTIVINDNYYWHRPFMQLYVHYNLLNETLKNSTYARNFPCVSSKPPHNKFLLVYKVYKNYCL